MFDEYKHPNETVRQTLERVMREKGKWQEPKVMHTEIGDFHYYNDNNTADNSGENNNAGLPSDYLQNHNAYGSVMGGAIENTAGANVAPNTSSFELQSTYTPSPVYGTSASNNYQIQSPSDFASPTTPNTFGSSQLSSSLEQTQVPNYTSSAANGWQINQATAATQNQQNQANQGQNVAWFGEPPAAIRQAIGRYAPDVLAQYSAPTSLGQISTNRSSYGTNNDKSISFKDIYYSKYDEKGNRIYKGIADEEGGFSDRVVDTPTNYGITQAALNEYNNWNSNLRTMYNLPEDVKLLKPEQAERIMDEMYHKRYSINKINRLPIAANVTDHIINGGTDAGWLLADTINDYKKSSYPRNTTISDNLALEINNLLENEVIPINDSFTQRRMDRYFKVIDRKPEKINNLNNWYDRIKKFHSSQDEFDRLYKSRKEEYFRKYKSYYTGK